VTMIGHPATVEKRAEYISRWPGARGRRIAPRPTRRIKFTDRGLKAIKPPPKPLQLDYFDESLPGFGMRISYQGRRSWICLYRVNGKKGRVTIGRADVLPLADAREKARELLKIATKATTQREPSTRPERPRHSPRSQRAIWTNTPSRIRRRGARMSACC
jgi:hypothetical protein